MTGSCTAGGGDQQRGVLRSLAPADGKTTASSAPQQQPSHQLNAITDDESADHAAGGASPWRLRKSARRLQDGEGREGAPDRRTAGGELAGRWAGGRSARARGRRPSVPMGGSCSCSRRPPTVAPPHQEQALCQLYAALDVPEEAQLCLFDRCAGVTPQAVLHLEIVPTKRPTGRLPAHGTPAAVAPRPDGVAGMISRQQQPHGLRKAASIARLASSRPPRSSRCVVAGVCLSLNRDRAGPRPDPRTPDSSSPAPQARSSPAVPAVAALCACRRPTTVTSFGSPGGLKRKLCRCVCFGGFPPRSRSVPLRVWFYGLRLSRLRGRRPGGSAITSR